MGRCGRHRAVAPASNTWSLAVNIYCPVCLSVSPVRPSTTPPSFSSTWLPSTAPQRTRNRRARNESTNSPRVQTFTQHSPAQKVHIYVYVCISVAHQSASVCGLAEGAEQPTGAPARPWGGQEEGPSVIQSRTQMQVDQLTSLATQRGSSHPLSVYLSVCLSVCVSVLVSVSVPEQFALLLSRAWRQTVRDSLANLLRATISVALAVLFGLIFGRLGKGTPTHREMEGCVCV